MYCGSIDLHLHLDGSVTPAFAQKYLEKYHLPFPKDLTKNMQVDSDCANLVDYLKCFDIPKMILQYEESLEECAYDLVCRLAEQGILYAEIRFAPSNHCEKGLSQEAVVLAVHHGIQRAVVRHPRIKIGLLLCFLVGNGPTNEETLETAIKLYGTYVNGLDLAGAEGLVPLTAYRSLFGRASAAGVPFTIHAGECGSYENIELAVSFGAKRIGHGIAAEKSPNCMKLLEDNDIVLECCFTSNLQTRAVLEPTAHPIYQFYQRGLKVTVNVDNTTVSNTDLEKEHLAVKKYFPFTDADFLQLDQNAIDGAFLSLEEKLQLRESIRKKYKRSMEDEHER